MAKRSLSQQLDELVDAVLAQPEVAEPALPRAEANLAALARLAARLRGLPRNEFKARLKTDLERRAIMATKPAMAAKARPIPEGFHTVTPYLCVRDAAGAIEFYKKAFGATETLRLPMPDGRIGHAEIQIGKSRIMLSDEFPEYGAVSPPSVGGSPVDIHFYVEDIDVWSARVIAAGARTLVTVADQDYGERYGRFEDPFGHRWGFSTPLKEDRAQQVREILYMATPYLVVADGAKAIDFYKEAFAATELMRLAEPDGRIAHAELTIGDSLVMLSGAAPDYGRLSPRSIGGTPVAIHLYVENVDAVANQAVAAGAKVLRPVQDQFYGDRSGRLEDPFGHVWTVATHIEDVAPEEILRRFDSFMNQPDPAAQQGAAKRTEATMERPAASVVQPQAPAKAVKRLPEGFHTVTPYLTVRQAPELLDFLKGAFGAEELLRTTGPAGGMHAEVRIGDSRLMIGGGGAWRGTPMPTALHLYVTDTDAVYQRALELGATSIHEPMDQNYGERSASVKDLAGNNWYIATTFGPTHIPEGLHSVNVYLHPRRADQVIDFLKQAFAAEEVARYAGPDGTIHHAQVRIGDSVIEMGEAHGPYQPMPTMFYLYVEDTDASYKRALQAGATSISQPADQPYGDRNASVKDPFDNVWYVATHVRDVRIS